MIFPTSVERFDRAGREPGSPNCEGHPLHPRSEKPRLTEKSSQISEKSNARPGYSFGWQRATLLGGFFNGVFLLALGISILLQSIERFIFIQRA